MLEHVQYVMMYIVFIAIQMRISVNIVIRVKGLMVLFVYHVWTQIVNYVRKTMLNAILARLGLE